MKLSKSQEEEIDWLVKHFAPKGYIPTQEDKEIYIRRTVYGEKTSELTGFHNSMDILTQAKRSLDIQIKMWRKDIADGLFALWEFDEDGLMDGYGDKIFKSIMTGLPNGNSEGIFRTNSILWANKRWNLDKVCDTFAQDYIKGICLH